MKREIFKMRFVLAAVMLLLVVSPKAHAIESRKSNEQLGKLLSLELVTEDVTDSWTEEDWAAVEGIVEDAVDEAVDEVTKELVAEYEPRIFDLEERATRAEKKLSDLKVWAPWIVVADISLILAGVLGGFLLGSR